MENFNKYHYINLDKENYLMSKMCDAFKINGCAAPIRDSAIILGVNHSSNEPTKIGITGYYWTSTKEGAKCASAVNKNGRVFYDFQSVKSNGLRFALPFKDINEITANFPYGFNNNGQMSVRLGYYFTMAPNMMLQEKLFRLKELGCLTLLEQKAFLKPIEWNMVDDKEKYDEHNIYYYEGKIYTLVKADSCDKTFKLLDGRCYHKGDEIWLEATPFLGTVSLDKKLVIVDDIITCGIPFTKIDSYIPILARDVKVISGICWDLEQRREISKNPLNEKLNETMVNHLIGKSTEDDVNFYLSLLKTSEMLKK